MVVASLVFVPVASAQLAPTQPLANTEARLIHYIAHDGVRRTAWLLAADRHARADPADHLAARPRCRRRRERPHLGRPARRRRLRGHQPGRRGAAAALVLVGCRGADLRSRAHARDRARPRRRRRTATGSMPSAARWAARRRSCWSRSTRACSPARRRSIPRPTCVVATTTSRRSRAGAHCSGSRARRWAGRRVRCPARMHGAAPTTTCGRSRSPACRCRSSGARATA